MTVGVWDQRLFEDFRRARGIRRRGLLNRLVIENAPLVKLLVDQLRGGPDARPRKGARPMGGCAGFRELEWEDAYQAGLLALTKTLEKFDPAKGKISGYLKLWIRHELQRLVYHGGQLVRIPRGRDVEPVPVALVGEQADLDLLSGGAEDGIAVLEDVTPEDLEAWEESGEWPESLEELQASRRPAPQVLVDERSPLERFLDTKLAFRPAARVARLTLLASWERFARAEGSFASVSALREGLAARGARATTLRVPWHPVPVSGYARVALTLARA